VLVLDGQDHGRVALLRTNRTLAGVGGWLGSERMLVAACDWPGQLGSCHGRLHERLGSCHAQLHERLGSWVAGILVVLPFPHYLGLGPHSLEAKGWVSSSSGDGRQASVRAHMGSTGLCRGWSRVGRTADRAAPAL